MFNTRFDVFDVFAICVLLDLCRQPYGLNIAETTVGVTGRIVVAHLAGIFGRIETVGLAALDRCQALRLAGLKGIGQVSNQHSPEPFHHRAYCR